MTLTGSGLINGAELEHIIERAMTQFEGRIVLDDIRALVEGTAFDEGTGGQEAGTVH